MSCGGWVIIFAVHFGKPQIAFWIPMIFFVQFFNCRYGIWYSIEAIRYTCLDDCIYHFNFLFDCSLAIY